MPFKLLLLALIFCSAPAFAIYKCESGDKIIYSDTPCQGDKTVSMKEIAIAAAASDNGAAQKQLQQDKKELQRLQQRREKQQTQDDRQQAKRYKTAETKKQKCAESAQRVQWAKEDAASAPTKSSERAKQKARRTTEKHQLSCGSA
ncbi:hypothetical protein [Herminiimonas fonticola]|uniref:DUF4124 domain-containing protein n=1 Tax=Herminiimonas fonticola TaxID=303380 RepID=A0A4R6G6E2_9BURK|nr:hypothetical protein [Herminiimonas fonticola]RBA24058.1 hypothetical protein Hfont_1870 [Herminiimonas fonticola]TDN90057.1 hypothetical protein EV677_2130 [Herminiimonas fonticola]